MDRFVRSDRASEGEVGEVGDDLVAVHVERGACTGLKDIHRELRSVRLEVGEDAVARADDGVGGYPLERAKLLVRQRGRLLEQNERTDEDRMLTQAADRIVLDRALRLRAVEGVVRNLDFSQSVFFDAHVADQVRGTRNEVR